MTTMSSFWPCQKKGRNVVFPQKSAGKSGEVSSPDQTLPQGKNGDPLFFLPYRPFPVCLSNSSSVRVSVIDALSFFPRQLGAGNNNSTRWLLLSIPLRPILTPRS